MAKIIDKLWNWGHLAGSHNQLLSLDCSMSPEQFGKKYGINKSFMVSYGGNIQPPYDELAKSMSALDEIKWSVLGDASTPLPDTELGNTEDVIAAAKVAKNITGAVVDDFFSPERLERFTPEVLSKMKNRLAENGLDFWCVLYEHNLDTVDLKAYLPCFDGVTFWLWKAEQIEKIEQYVQELKSMIGNKPLMLGIYLWDYGNAAPMNTALFEKQLSYSFKLIENGEIEGAVICSNTIGDADLETNKILKQYIKKYGRREVLSKI